MGGVLLVRTEEIYPRRELELVNGETGGVDGVSGTSNWRRLMCSMTLLLSLGRRMSSGDSGSSKLIDWEAWEILRDSGVSRISVNWFGREKL